jgi:hypothetical protein
MISVTNLARIASLLHQLTHSGLLRRLAFIDQTCGELNAEGLDGRTVLHDNHRAHGLAGVFEDRHDSYGINTCGLAGFASGGFPDAFLAVLWKLLTVSNYSRCSVRFMAASMAVQRTWSDH